MITFTPGPFRVEQQERFPFNIHIVGPDGAIEVVDKWAYSSSQKTLADCEEGYGFPPEEKAEVVAGNSRQLADLRLRAAAPALYEALKEAREGLRYVRERHGVDGVSWDLIDQAADAALAAATGDA
jgi:hypothetical protein